MAKWQIIQGDWIEQLKLLPSDHFHCCISSPPYYGLRNYGVDKALQVGLEANEEEFLNKIITGYNEVKRILRQDGLTWINMVDTYRNKQLTLLPFRMVLALQQNGWFVRSTIIWNKPTAMPESVMDRCSTSHEYIFMLSKTKTYYFDKHAIKEPCAEGTYKKMQRGCSGNGKYGNNPELLEVTMRKSPQNINKKRESRFRSEKHNNHNQFNNGNYMNLEDSDNDNIRFTTPPSVSLTRGKRTVWNIPSIPCKDAHFATFPTTLVEPMVLSSTSEYGCCANCGKQYSRIVEPSEEYKQYLGKGYHDHTNDLNIGMQQPKQDDFRSTTSDYITIGWQKSCACNTDEIVATRIIDPFSGSGTTVLVANRNRREGYGIELNPAYVEISRKRIIKDFTLFNTIEEV